MGKKINILFLLIVLPTLLGFIYDENFRYSGGWLEDYQNYFKIGFIVISILGSVWLIYISKKEKRWVWFISSGALLIILILYLYLGFAVINYSF